MFPGKLDKLPGARELLGRLKEGLKGHRWTGRSYLHVPRLKPDKGPGAGGAGNGGF